MTNQQGAPEALRLADWLQNAVATYPQMSEDEPGGYCQEVDQVMDEAAAELRRLHAENERLAALVDAQQPAPSAASKAVLAAIRAANMQLVRTGDDEFMLVTYKNAKAQCDGGQCGIGGYCDDCPMPQADSQPSLTDWYEGITEKHFDLAVHKAVQRDRAARAPADSVTAPAGGGVGIYVASRASLPERPAYWRALRAAGWPIVSTWIDEAGPGETTDLCELWARIIREISSARGLVLHVEADDFPLKGALIEVGAALSLGKRVGVYAPGVVLEDRSMRPLGSWAAHPLVRLCPTLADAREWAESMPTPPAQAADSVLEDAARWFAERDNVLQSFWVLLGEAEAQADNDNNPLLKHQVEGFYRKWNALNGTTLGPRWVTRAARKQGANHD